MKPLLADFGIATKQNSTNISRGGFIGIRLYMAPEELQGIADQKSDQYALGVIAYELFTGHVPFDSLDVIETLPPISLRKSNPTLPPYIDSRFAHFLRQKMNCIPHFGAENAHKMMLIPHLAKAA